MTASDLRNDRLRLGEIDFDLKRSVLLNCDGQPIAMRTKSLRVLVELAARNGEIVGKDELIAAVWAGRSVSDDNLVQSIKDIRAALNDQDRRLLRTAVGRGYSLHGDPIESDTTGEQPRVLIAPFSISSTATDLSDLSEAIVEEIILVLSPRAGFAVLTDEGNGALADYSIMGRVSANEGTPRVYVQLTSRASRRVVFAETWTAAVGETSSLPREIAEKIASIVRIHVFNSAGEGFLNVENASLTTQELLSKAAYYMSRIQMEYRDVARDALTLAVEREPENAMALAMRVSSALILVLQEGVQRIPDPPEYCIELADRAVGIAPHVDFVMLTRGSVRMWLQSDHEGARADFMRALEVSPVFHLAHQFMAISEILSGDHARAIPRVRKIMELGTVKNPRYPHYLALLALAQMLADDSGAAFETAQEGHERAPGDPWCGYVFASACARRTDIVGTKRFQRMIDGLTLPFSHFRSLPFTSSGDVRMLEGRLEAVGYPIQR